MGHRQRWTDQPRLRQRVVDVGPVGARRRRRRSQKHRVGRKVRQEVWDFEGLRRCQSLWPDPILNTYAWLSNHFELYCVTSNIVKLSAASIFNDTINLGQSFKKFQRRIWLLTGIDQSEKIILVTGLIWLVKIGHGVKFYTKIFVYNWLYVLITLSTSSERLVTLARNHTYLCTKRLVLLCLLGPR